MLLHKPECLAVFLEQRMEDFRGNGGGWGGVCVCVGEWCAAGLEDLH